MNLVPASRILTNSANGEGKEEKTTNQLKRTETINNTHTHTHTILSFSLSLLLHLGNRFDLDTIGERKEIRRRKENKALVFLFFFSFSYFSPSVALDTDRWYVE